MEKIDLSKLYEKGLKEHHVTNTAYPLTPGSFMNYKITDTEEIEKLLTRNLGNINELAFYIHIPFCKSRCNFCEYAVVSTKEELDDKDRYVEYVMKEIVMYKHLARGKKIIGFDMGGGTPTELSFDQIKLITDKLTSTFDFDASVGFSIETTPFNAANDLDKLIKIRELGYERISMGVQTIDKSLLAEFSREGSKALYNHAVRNIRKAGFEKFNIDLMYGFLNQKIEDFGATIEYTTKILKPEYVTIYRNKYKGTKLVKEAEHVTLDKVNAQYDLAYSMLNNTGYYAPYGKNVFSKIKNDWGTSNYITKRMIEGIPYLGFGLGAQSFGQNYLSYNSGKREKQLKNYYAKIDNGEYPLQDIYDLPVDEIIAKMVSVSFYSGFVDFKHFTKKFNLNFEEYFEEELAFLKDRDLVKVEDEKMVVTKLGMEQLSGVTPMFYSNQSKLELLNREKFL
jgi:oxygen-independent coproporphyrinogen-3 oxidase